MIRRRLPALLGVTLLIAAAGIVLFLSRPVREENAMLSKENRLAERAMRADPDQIVSKKLAAFAASLPTADGINPALDILHGIAASHGLSLEHSSYKPDSSARGGIGKLAISIKTSGEYPEVRRFIDEARRRLPSLAVRQVAFSRQKISDTRLDTVIEFVLYYTQDGMR